VPRGEGWTDSLNQCKVLEAVALRSDRENEDRNASSTSPNSPRGFGGLASLVSVLPEPSAKSMPPIVSAGTPPPSASEHSRLATDANLTGYQLRNSLSLLKTAAIAFGLAFAAISIILATQPSRSLQRQGNQSGVSSNVNSSSPQQTREPQAYSPSDSESPRYAASASPPEEALREVAPSQGTNLVLNASEIDYCLSEGIRLDAMRPLLAEKSRVQLREFNLRSEDFKSRCAKFRYRESDMNRVKKIVDSKMSQLRLEAMSAMSH
jgi:hypothetical protein